LAAVGGEPAWQAVHGWPFARAGVAIAFGVATASIANASNATVAVTTVPCTIVDLIAFALCIVNLQIAPIHTDILRKACPDRRIITGWQRQATSKNN
jgi:hypothetical protein